MTRVIFETADRSALKPFVALAKNQGISVKYLRKQTAKTKSSDEIIDKLYGSWKDDRTADEMIEDIYSSRYFSKEKNLELFDD